MLMETGAPSGLGRFTHHSSPNILVMPMATSDAREDAQAPEPAEERDPEPEAEESQRTEENEKDNEQTNK